jgi:hypothetical protein
LSTVYRRLAAAQTDYHSVFIAGVSTPLDTFATPFSDARLGRRAEGDQRREGH